MVFISTASRSSKIAELLHVVLVTLQILADDQIFDSLAYHSRVGLKQRVLHIAFTIMSMSQSQSVTVTVAHVMNLSWNVPTYQLVDDL